MSVSAAPLCRATWSVLSLLISYWGSSLLAWWTYPLYFTSFVCTLTILPLTLPSSEFHLTRSCSFNRFFIHQRAPKKGAASDRRPPDLSWSLQSDREDRNDLVATIDDNDLVANQKVPESPPLVMDVHDDRRDFNHAHARRHHGAHVDREVDIGGTRHIAAGQDRLSDLGALLRR